MIGAMIKTCRSQVLLTACAALLAGCVSIPPETATEYETCEDLIRRVDLRISDLRMTDAEATPVAEFPYLRTNRFLASFRDELATHANPSAAFEDWVDRMRTLDRTARAIELRNLGAENITATVDACAMRMLETDQQAPGFMSAVRAAVFAPSHYEDGVRAVGLYPITQWGVALGFERWKQENLPSFSEDPARWAATEKLYGLHRIVEVLIIRQAEVGALIDLASNNALGIPDIAGSVLQDIARRYAPLFAVEQASEADEIGHPEGSATAAPTTNPGDPVLFVRLAHTRFDGEVLPQLVYSVWFPARPKTGPLDILGGAMDGIYWRVTLDRKGEPLIYDTFHACGCYHLFFPTPSLQRVHVEEDEDLREEPLVPMAAPALAAGERLVVHIAAGSHYVRGLSVSAKAADIVALRLVDEMAAPQYGLRSIPVEDGRYASFFAPDGLMTGTERLERFLLWPMGISSPGAMRQWGTHATAFVGERHADDAFLFDRAFAR